VFVSTDDGCRLHVIPGSSGSVPMVLSNSLGTDHSLWDFQLAALSHQRAVWRYDTRGHGGSDKPPGDYSIDRLGKDLVAIIDATGVERVDLCGVSIGGMTALWVALHAPDRVRRVVLANTAAQIGDVGMWSARINTVRTEGVGALADATMTRWFTPEFRAARPEVVARFHSTIAQSDTDGYAGCCAALRDADLRALVPQVACPALVVAGRHDPATPPAQGRWLAEQIRGAKVVELEAAHLSNVERSEEFNVAVAIFLGDD
jgi:3-oxoadipate enol-lactonase